MWLKKAILKGMQWRREHCAFHPDHEHLLIRTRGHLLGNFIQRTDVPGLGFQGIRGNLKRCHLRDTTDRSVSAKFRHGGCD